MANYVFVAQSLDGFIASKDGSTRWLNIPNPTKTDYGYNNFLDKIDAFVIGRLTFEKALKYKPYPYNKQVFVLSTTLKNIPINLQDSVEIVNGDLKSILLNIYSKGFNNLYIDGGKTIQSFLKEDLIDEITINTLPIILGEGIKLFENINRTITLELKNIENYENGIITSIYKKQEVES